MRKPNRKIGAGLAPAPVAKVEPEWKTRIYLFTRELPNRTVQWIYTLTRDPDDFYRITQLKEVGEHTHATPGGRFANVEQANAALERIRIAHGVKCTMTDITDAAKCSNCDNFADGDDPDGLCANCAHEHTTEHPVEESL